MIATLTRYGIPTVLLGGLIVVVYVLASATDTGEPDAPLQALATGSMSKVDFIADPPARPDGTFFDPDGTEMTLADREGMVILVNLWATWCPPCLTEMPTLAALQRAKGSDRFEVMAISVDQIGDKDFAMGELSRLSRGDLDFYHDPTYELPYDVSVRGFPTSILYDASGQEVARLAGDADWSTAEAMALIDAIIAEADDAGPEGDPATLSPQPVETVSETAR